MTSHAHRAVLLVLAATLGLTGCATGAVNAGGTSVDGAIMTTAQPVTSDCGGVRVIVDFGLLDTRAVNACVTVSQATPAREVLASAGVTLQGTDAYGDAVVCRVNDLPDATTPVNVDGHDPFVETCASMPPEFAYWALWVKQGTPDWGYAMVGVGDLELNPGESIGLVFTTGTATPTPS